MRRDSSKNSYLVCKASQTHANFLVYKGLVVTFPLYTYRDIQSSSFNSEYRRRWENTASILPRMLVRTQTQTQTQCRFFPPLIETRNQASVVQMTDNASHWINLYPLDSAIGFPNHPPSLSGFDRLPWPVNSAIQLLPNSWGQRSVWDRSHVNSE